MSGQRGSLFRRTPKGKWYGRWREPDPITGKLVHRSRALHHNKREAAAMLNRILAGLDEDQPTIPAEQPTGQLVTDWLAGRRLADSTKRVYRSYSRNHILPRFGDTPINKLTATRISAWISDLEAAGLSSSTIYHSYTILAGALDAAVEDGAIRANPARRRSVELPRTRYKDIQVLSPAELRALFDAIAGHKYEPLIRFLAGSQCRISEALSLTWDAIDWQANTVYIPDSKTESGVRTISLNSATMAALRRRSDQQKFLIEAGIVSPGTPYVFCYRDERPLTKAPVGVNLAKFCQAAGIKRIHPHVLRHTGATLMLRARVPVHIVAARLGHKDAGVTLSTYSHLLPGDDAEALATLDEILGEDVG
ncbi:MAG TPA: tyrosine-type recombinase/integrase [Guyparkeria sp.]|nr:tyrosine-type recombinase/integrase [Guyparkeria sp.]